MALIGGVPEDMVEAVSFFLPARRSEMEKVTLSVAETAEALGLGRSHVYELVRRGRIPACHFGRRVLIPRRSLERMLEELGAASADHDPNLMP